MKTFVVTVLVLCCVFIGCSRKPTWHERTVQQSSRNTKTNQIESLNVEQARKLVQSYKNNDYGLLTLDGLTSIDKDVAHELSEMGSLHLNGLTSINRDVAHELAKASFLYLNGLTTIDTAVAHELAKGARMKLQLNGLTSIDREVAKELAKRTGPPVELNGLTSIDEVADILKSKRGFLTKEEISEMEASEQEKGGNE